VDDVNLSLAHYSNCFDVVHARLVDAGIANHAKFVNEAARILRPGGVILLVQGYLQLFTDSFQPLPVLNEGEDGFTFLQTILTATYRAIKYGTRRRCLPVR
jgi:SAM-dependent methyltransferase